jgi:hypothetical protein
MCARAGLIAKIAIVSGPPARTVISRGDDPPSLPRACPTEVRECIGQAGASREQSAGLRPLR